MSGSGPGGTPTLRDLGERRIVRELLPRYVQGMGDDCAIVDGLSGTVVITTDPVPYPAAASLGGDADPYFAGWLLVTINASDLAAAGAEARAFVAAIEAPADASVKDLEQFLGGIAAACVRQGLVYIGGNLREGARLGGTGTAVGCCPSWPPLTRVFLEADSVVMSIGSGGVFWRDAKRLAVGQVVPREASPVFLPVSQVGITSVMAQRGLLLGAMDNSDGLLPTLEQLALASGTSITVDTMLLTSGASGVATDESVRAWLGWGDWNVLAAVAVANVTAVAEVAAANGSVATVIGRATRTENAGVFLQRGGRVIRAGRLESERFAADSWFDGGVEQYRRKLEAIELP